MSTLRWKWPLRHLVGAGWLVVIGACSLAPESAPNRCLSDASLINPETNAAPGIGGTGQIAGRPGIGGTGQTQTIARPGIGGTGIVGVVTGFASLCVNGEEIHYSPTTPVSQDGENSSTRDLLVGQVVVVQATSGKAESGSQWQARQIVVQHAVIGPLTEVDSRSGQFSVMGERALALSTEDLAGLKPGDWVRVSGQRQSDGLIRAGRVQPLPSAAAQASIQGTLAKLQGHRALVGGTAVQFAALPDGLRAGEEVLVRGVWDGRQLQVEESVLHPTNAILRNGDRVLLQGYVHARQGRELKLGYESVLLPEDTVVTPLDQPVLVRGRINTDQGIVAEQIVIGSGNHAPGHRGGFTSTGRGAGASAGMGGWGGGGNAGGGGNGGGHGGGSGGGSGGGHGGGSGGGGGGGSGGGR